MTCIALENLRKGYMIIHKHSLTKKSCGHKVYRQGKLVDTVSIMDLLFASDIWNYCRLAEVINHDQKFKKKCNLNLELQW